MNGDCEGTTATALEPCLSAGRQKQGLITADEGRRQMDKSEAEGRINLAAIKGGPTQGKGNGESRGKADAEERGALRIEERDGGPRKRA